MKCTIISGSPEGSVEFIKTAAENPDFLICADSGYSYAKAAGLKPDVVIGDFDSCREEVSGDFEIVRLNSDKDFTDTLICADKALENGYNEITILAAVGGRLDHTLGNLFLLDYIAQKGAKAVLLSEKERVELLTTGETVFSGLDSLTFSLFAFGCESVTLSVSGARYELSGYNLKSSLPIGISNVFSGDECRIDVKNGKALIVINQSDEFL